MFKLAFSGKPMQHISKLRIFSYRNTVILPIRRIFYQQGQELGRGSIREYFYYIDHNGWVFMDDLKLKTFTTHSRDPQFLTLFYKRLKKNNTGRYPEFPYLSICAGERNFIRCEDTPIVFTHIVPDPEINDEFRICYGYVNNDFYVKLEPEKFIMLPKTERVYHPAPETAGGIGLIRLPLAIEISKYFIFENSEDKPPTHYSWNNKIYKLVKWCDEPPIPHM